jgi:Xaa-Pro dipeptidase
MHHLHRSKLFDLLAEAHGSDAVLISGARVQYRHDTDTELPFRQESDFLYLTGVTDPDFALVLDVARRETHLFAPKRDALFAVWHGFVEPLEALAERHRPDHIHHAEALPEVLRKIGPKSVHVRHDTDASLAASHGFRADATLLRDMLAHCRVLKTAPELDLMRRANAIASAAHDAVREALRPGLREFEVKALYEQLCTREGCVFTAYNGIFASGEASAVLHYTKSDRVLKDGGLMLIDAGAEYEGYAADLTRTWPVNGAFTPIQQDIYDAVLRMQTTALNAAAPGVAMEDLQLMACRTLLEDLSAMGLVKGGIDELMEKNIFALFFPHGLGHFLGLDTHDPGGYPKGVERIDRPGLRYLRARRTLEPGMVVTIEPGCYLIPALLEPAFADPATAPYLNEARLRPLLSFGGVRIEDNIIVTADGIENMTTART